MRVWLRKSTFKDTSLENALFKETPLHNSSSPILLDWSPAVKTEHLKYDFLYSQEESGSVVLQESVVIIFTTQL